MSDDSAVSYDIPSPAALSEMLPQYSVEEVIACGGMGAVYKAQHTSLERTVAIKLLPEHLSADEEFREQFHNEARLMGKFSHPNVISVYDFGEADGLLYLVMEFVGDGSLYDAMCAEYLGLRPSLELMRDISKGLGHAHAAGILHRDMKPANVLMRDQVPMIGDFGLARLDDGSEEGDVYGTPGYAAPELYEEQPRVGVETDIFALGVMLYEMLTSQLPDQENYQSVHQVIQCPPMLDQVLRKAMHADQDQRYGSAEDFAEAIEKVLERLPKQQMTTAAGQLQVSSKSGGDGSGDDFLKLKHNKKKHKTGVFGTLVKTVLVLLVLAAATVYGLDAVGVIEVDWEHLKGINWSETGVMGGLKELGKGFSQ